MRLIPATIASSAILLTAAVLPHIAPASWDGFAAGLLLLAIVCMGSVIYASFRKD